MKLGSAVIDPVTGEQGFVCRFIAGVPIGRAPDGTMFKVKGPLPGAKKRGPKPMSKECRVQLIGFPGWHAGEIVDGGRARIVSGDPVWQGAVVDRTEAVILRVPA